MEILKATFHRLVCLFAGDKCKIFEGWQRESVRDKLDNICVAVAAAAVAIATAAERNNLHNDHWTVDSGHRFKFTYTLDALYALPKPSDSIYFSRL